MSTMNERIEAIEAADRPSGSLLIGGLRSTARKTDRIPIVLARILADKDLGISVCRYDNGPDGPVKKDDGRLTDIFFSSLDARSAFFSVCETPEYKALMWSLRPRSFRDSRIDDTAVQATDVRARELLGGSRTLTVRDIPSLLEPVVDRILTAGF